MEIDWIKYGFEESELLKGEFTRKDFPFVLEVIDNHLHVLYRHDTETEYTISLRDIPATNQAVVLLLKAFNCPKNP